MQFAEDVETISEEVPVVEGQHIFFLLLKRKHPNSDSEDFAVVCCELQQLQQQTNSHSLKAGVHKSIHGGFQGC